MKKGVYLFTKAQPSYHKSFIALININISETGAIICRFTICDPKFKYNILNSSTNE